MRRGGMGALGLHVRWGSICSVLVLIGLCALPASATRPVQVRYRSVETVYLDAGTIDGLASGQRLEVLRGDTVIAEVEVFFASENSASCRPLIEHQKVAVGDSIRWERAGREAASASVRAPESEPPRDAGSSGPTLPPGGGEALDHPGEESEINSRGLLVRARSRETIYLERGAAEIGDELEVVREGSSIARLLVEATTDEAVRCKVLAEHQTIRVGDMAVFRAPEPRTGQPVKSRVAASKPPELALEAGPVEPLRWQPRARGATSQGTRVTGTLSLDWETARESSGREATDYERSNGRLDLRVANIGGQPYELRLRMRTQQNTRGVEGQTLTSEARDRFYELSLTHDPPQGRFAYRVGRMSASPFVGIGYFDGVLGQVALSSIFEVGGFVGSAAEVEKSGFSTSRQKYGLFTRFTSPTTDSGFPWEVVLAGVREHGEQEISREYVTLQSRYSAGGKWSFFQRAEVDVNRGWRKELSGRSSQLSNLSLSTTARLSRYGRFSLAYDRFEQYRTEETRELPEDLFRDLQRQGLRANLQFGNPRRLNFALTGSLRDQQGEAVKTLAYGFWVRHGSVTPWGVSMALNYVGYSNAFTQGYIVTFRSSKRLSVGHQLDLTLGSKLSGNEVFTEAADERTEWVRLRAWFELPGSVFATGEYELSRGDAVDGQRLAWGLGYRF